MYNNIFKKIVLVMAVSCVMPVWLYAQPSVDGRDGFAAYIMAEWQLNQLLDIYPMLYNEQLFPSRDVDDLIINSYGARLGMMSTFDGSPFFTTIDLGVSTYEILTAPLEGGHFRLENSAGLKNRIIFDHDRFSVNVMGGFRVGNKAAVSPHLQFGFRWDLAMGTNVRYDSNEPQFDLDIRQSLEDGVSQRNNFSLAGAFGIDWWFAGQWQITAKAHYDHGIVDVLRTEPNPFLWRDLKTNKLHAYGASLTLTYFIDD